jgi:hypothetical protein
LIDFKEIKEIKKGSIVLGGEAVRPSRRREGDSAQRRNENAPRAVSLRGARIHLSELGTRFYKTRQYGTYKHAQVSKTMAETLSLGARSSSWRVLKHRFLR